MLHLLTHSFPSLLSAVLRALLAALASFIGLRGEQFERDQPWGLEAALFVFAILGMTFFGHLGQVYQTGSPLWKPLLAWLVLFAPIMLLRGQSWFAAALVTGALVYASWDYAFAYESRSEERRGGKEWFRTCISRWAP